MDYTAGTETGFYLLGHPMCVAAAYAAWGYDPLARPFVTGTPAGDLTQVVIDVANLVDVRDWAHGYLAAMDPADPDIGEAWTRYYALDALVTMATAPTGTSVPSPGEQ
jgi:hypothetical protein